MFEFPKSEGLASPSFGGAPNKLPPEGLPPNRPVDGDVPKSDVFAVVVCPNKPVVFLSAFPPKRLPPFPKDGFLSPSLGGANIPRLVYFCGSLVGAEKLNKLPAGFCSSFFASGNGTANENPVFFGYSSSLSLLAGAPAVGGTLLFIYLIFLLAI